MRKAFSLQTATLILQQQCLFFNMSLMLVSNHFPSIEIRSVISLLFPKSYWGQFFGGGNAVSLAVLQFCGKGSNLARLHFFLQGAWHLNSFLVVCYCTVMAWFFFHFSIRLQSLSCHLKWAPYMGTTSVSGNVSHKVNFCPLSLEIKTSSLPHKKSTSPFGFWVIVINKVLSSPFQLMVAIPRVS